MKTMHSKLMIAVIIICGVLVGSLLFAVTFGVTQNASGDQELPDVAMDTEGNFVVVWQDKYTLPSSTYEIYARRFDKFANPLSESFQVNTYSNDDQTLPSIAMDPIGNFIIVWASEFQDGSEEGVFAKKYDKNGNIVVNEFQVNTSTDGYQTDPQISIYNNGNFIIAWTGNEPSDSYYDIFARRFDKDCNPLGGEIIVNDITDGFQWGSSIASDNENIFVITWQNGTSDADIYSKLYNSDGTTKVDEFIVNTFTNEGQILPSVAMDSDGDFVISWGGDDYEGDSWNDIFARMFDKDGNPKGDEFQVNTDNDYVSYNSSSVSMDSVGNFIITYSLSQKFLSNGTKTGSEFEPGIGAYFEIDMLSLENFVIVWQKYDSYSEDWDVYGHLYPDETPTPTVTQTPSQTITDTETQTPTITKTPSKTPTPTYTTPPTLTPTKTPTITETPVDFPPILDDGKVTTDTGFQSTKFNYSVHYKDLDGGAPPVKRVYYKENEYKSMILDSGVQSDGWYKAFIYGYELNIGQNEFYFYFADNEYNYVRLPSEGTFEGPFVEVGITPTPEGTITITPTMTITETPSLTETPQKTLTATVTTTPTDTEPLDCFRITSPSDFYYNSIILSWTPVINVDKYRLYVFINKNLHFIDLENNYLTIISQDEVEWNFFVNLGTVYYLVQAMDADGNVIVGPTDVSSFTCYFNQNGSSDNFNKPAQPGCLTISSPPEFYYNTVILSWTPINGAYSYKLKYRYSTWVFEGYVEENYLRIIAPDPATWDALKSVGTIHYSVTTLDSEGNIIDGPTEWEGFSCM